MLPQDTVRNFRNTLWDQARTVDNQAKAETASAGQSLNRLMSIVAEINALRDEFNAHMNSSWNTLNRTQDELDSALEIYQVLPCKNWIWIQFKQAINCTH